MGTRHQNNLILKDNDLYMDTFSPWQTYIDEACAARSNGQEFSSIRKTLQEKGVSEEAMAVIMKAVDEFDRNQHELKKERQQSLTRMILGIFVILLGLIIFYIIYSDPTIRRRFVIFALIPFYIGFRIFRKAYRSYNNFEIIA